MYAHLTPTIRDAKNDNLNFHMLLTNKNLVLQSYYTVLLSCYMVFQDSIQKDRLDINDFVSRWPVFTLYYDDDYCHTLLNKESKKL